MWETEKIEFWLTSVDVIYTQTYDNGWRSLSVYLDTQKNELVCFAGDSGPEGRSRVTLTVPRQFLIDSDEIQALYDRVMSEGINA